MFIGDDFVSDYDDYYSEEEEEDAYFEALIEEKKQKEQDLSWLYEEYDPYANEEWRPIPGYEGLYEVSNMGRVKSLDREVKRWNKGSYVQPERILEPYLKRGYPTVALRKNNEETFRGGVHMLVARTFLPNPENKPFIDHFDTNRENNKINNLSWVTRDENAKNPLTAYHISCSNKNRLSKLKGRTLSQEQIEKSILTRHQKGQIHLQEDENGNLIYKNGLIDPRKYQD